MWLSACLGVLVFAWRQQAIDDMPVVFIWLMILLSLPIGFAVAAGLGLVAASFASGTVSHPFWDIVPIWAVLTVVGYAQWFICLPWLWGRIRAKHASF